MLYNHFKSRFLRNKSTNFQMVDSDNNGKRKIFICFVASQQRFWLTDLNHPKNLIIIGGGHWKRRKGSQKLAMASNDKLDYTLDPKRHAEEVVCFLWQSAQNECGVDWSDQTANCGNTTANYTIVVQMQLRCSIMYFSNKNSLLNHQCLLRADQNTT